MKFVCVCVSVCVFVGAASGNIFLTLKKRYKKRMFSVHLWTLLSEDTMLGAATAAVPP